MSGSVGVLFHRWTLQTPLTAAEMAILSNPVRAISGLGPLRSDVRGADSFLRAPDFEPWESIDALYDEGERALERESQRAMGAYGLALRLAVAVASTLGGDTEVVAQTIAGRLALALYRCGELTEALSLQEAFIRSLQARPRRPADVLAARAMQAQMILDTGEPLAALRLQTKLFEEATTLLGPDSALANGIRSDLSATQIKLGNLSGAVQEAARAERQSTAGRESLMDTVDYRIVAKANRAAALYEQGRYEEAFGLEVDNLDRLRAELGPGHRLTMLAANNLALTLKRLGRMDDAELLLRETVVEMSRAGGATGPDATLALANHLAILIDMKRPEECLVAVSAVLPELGALAPYGTRIFFVASASAWAIAEVLATESVAPELHLQAFSLCALMPGTSVLLCEAAEVLTTASSETALVDFVRFHEVWSKISILAPSTPVAQAVAALHGIDSWSTLLELAEPIDGSPRDESCTEFSEARNALRELRERLGAPSETGRLNATAATSNPAEGLLALEKTAMARYRDARRRLLDTHPTFATLTFDGVMVRLAEPAKLLDPEEALLVTLPLGRGRSVAHMTLHGGEVVLAGLPKLENLAQGNERGPSLDDAVRGGDVGWRGIGGQGLTRTPADVRQQILEDFWSPVLTRLAEAGVLRSIRLLHIVTAPSHHAVPLDAANPGIGARYYCGLPAFVRHRARRRLPKVRSSARICIDQALDSEHPIPFTAVEARLAEPILGCDGPVAVARWGDGSSSSACDRLLIACHGVSAGIGTARHGRLVLNAREELSMPPTKARSLGAGADEIVVSACLAGVVGRARWGDALGLVAQWQLLGVGAIVSCSRPVHDFYMPLLVAFYLHHRVCRLPAEEALRAAKEQLIMGTWPEDSVGWIRAVYRSEMEALLLRCARGGCVASDVAVVGAWPLDAGLKLSLRAVMSSGLSPASKRDALVHLWSTPEGRSAWVEPCLAALIDARAERPASADAVQVDIREKIDHICTYTSCHGSA